MTIGYIDMTLLTISTNVNVTDVDCIKNLSKGLRPRRRDTLGSDDHLRFCRLRRRDRRRRPVILPRRRRRRRRGGSGKGFGIMKKGEVARKKKIDLTLDT